MRVWFISWPIVMLAAVVAMVAVVAIAVVAAAPVIGWALWRVTAWLYRVAVGSPRGP